MVVLLQFLHHGREKGELAAGFDQSLGLKGTVGHARRFLRGKNVNREMIKKRPLIYGSGPVNDFACEAHFRQHSGIFISLICILIT